MLRRLLVGSLGSVFWPAVVLLIPAGITFASARVFAESSAPPPPNCSEPRFVACDGGTEDRFCSAQCTDAKRCVCSSRAGASGSPGVATCANGSAGLVKALQCIPVYICEDFVAHTTPCDGKAVDAGCDLNGPGHCRTDTCSVSGDGGLVEESRLFCRTDPPGPGDPPPPGNPPPDPPAATDAGAGGGQPTSTLPDASASASAAKAQDSGCSTTSSSVAGAAGLLAGPLALGLLLARRRRRAPTP